MTLSNHKGRRAIHFLGSIFAVLSGPVCVPPQRERRKSAGSLNETADGNWAYPLSNQNSNQLQEARENLREQVTIGEIGFGFTSDS